MTNEEKFDKITGLVAETGEFSKEIPDDELEQVSGGSFNMDVVDRLHLKVITGKHSGMQGLLGNIEYRQGSGPTDVIRREGMPISESSLRAYMNMPGELIVEARTTIAGGPITLGKDEILALLS
ncbi:MAG: hypothetical protein LBK04_02660 [Clostridiales Family XIII bacterium]|nr:hypothetical protein [Clostridiales Family XIII bacterium]